MSRHPEKPSDAELLQGTLDIPPRVPLSRALRLENQGWLKAEWKTTKGGRDAKFYSFTKTGQRQLTAETAD